MSDTVPAAVITGSLANGKWTFLRSDLPQSAGVMHVNGAAHADASPPVLLVAFSTVSSDLQVLPVASPPSNEPPATIGGYGATLPDAQPVVIAGAVQQQG